MTAAAPKPKQRSDDGSKYIGEAVSADQVAAGKHLEHCVGVSVDTRQLIAALLEEDPTKRPTLTQILHHPAIERHVCALLKSTQFRKQLAAGLEQKLEFGWASAVDVAEYSRLQTEFKQTDGELAGHWINQYFKRLGFNFRCDSFKPASTSNFSVKERESEEASRAGEDPVEELGASQVDPELEHIDFETCIADI